MLVTADAVKVGWLCYSIRALAVINYSNILNVECSQALILGQSVPG